MVAIVGVVVTQEQEVGATQEAVEVTRDTEVEVIQVPEVMEAAAGQVGSGILGDTGQHAPGKNVYLVI